MVQVMVPGTPVGSWTELLRPSFGPSDGHDGYLDSVSQIHKDNKGKSTCRCESGVLTGMSQFLAAPSGGGCLGALVRPTPWGKMKPAPCGVWAAKPGTGGASRWRVRC